MSTGGDYGTAGKLDFELHALPQENNVLAHLATQWIEQAEAILAGKDMLNVAKGGMPPAAERIIDTPISAIPGGLNRRDDQARLNLIADNQRNQLRREELLLSSWTSVISLRGTAIRCRENRFLTLRGTSSSVQDGRTEPAMGSIL